MKNRTGKSKEMEQINIDVCKAELETLKNGDQTIPHWTAPLPNIAWGKVVRIIDGDTVEVVAPVWPSKELSLFKIRLDGIQCPEVSNKAKVSKAEQAVGLEAKFLVQQRWLNKMVLVKPRAYEMFGRLLAKLIDEEEICINDWLISQHLAVEWDGSAKITNMDWKKYRESVK